MWPRCGRDAAGMWPKCRVEVAGQRAARQRVARQRVAGQRVAGQRWPASSSRSTASLQRGRGGQGFDAGTCSLLLRPARQARECKAGEGVQGRRPSLVGTQGFSRPMAARARTPGRARTARQSCSPSRGTSGRPGPAAAAAAASLSSRAAAARRAAAGASPRAAAPRGGACHQRATTRALTSTAGVQASPPVACPGPCRRRSPPRSVSARRGRLGSGHST